MHHTINRFLFVVGVVGLFVVGLYCLPIQPSMSQGQPAAIYCNGAAQYDASTNGSTRLVTARQNGAIYVCGYTFFSAGTANVSLVYGTGTTCATGETAVTPAYQFTTQTGIAEASSAFRGMFVPPNNDLCIKTSAGVAVQAIAYYVQR